MDKLNEEINKITEEKAKIKENLDLYEYKVKKLEDEITSYA